MSTLTSKLFTQGDQATVTKLEDCATGRPNEVKSHFTIGQTGEHIKKVQEALKSVQEADPGLGIPEFSVNGVYDQRFANAIRAYKTKRDIRNFANNIDDIVGIKTIRSLDNENKSGPPKVNPSPSPRPRQPGEFPRPLPNCVPDSDCPSSKKFDVTLVAGTSGGEVVEIGKFFFAIRDTTNGLSSAYLLTVGGFGAGSPLSLVGKGGAKSFTTSQPVRVTRFGPFGSMGSSTNVAGVPINFALLVLGFHPDGLVPRPTAPMLIDTGPIPIPGASIHAGQLNRPH
jgi:hypothetical protein